MKRLLTAIFLSALMMSTAFAECATTQQTIVYFDAERFFNVDSVLNISQDRGFQMVMEDVREGRAMLVPKGLRLDEVKRYNEHISVARVKNTLVVIINDHFSCR